MKQPWAAQHLALIPASSPVTIPPRCFPLCPNQHTHALRCPFGSSNPSPNPSASPTLRPANAQVPAGTASATIRHATSSAIRSRSATASLSTTLNGDPPAIAGIAEVIQAGHPDPTAFDPSDHHFDARSKPADPTWYQVTIRAVRAIDPPLGLPDLRQQPALKAMELLRKGSRLSVQPVRPEEWAAILSLAEAQTSSLKKSPRRSSPWCRAATSATSSSPASSACRSWRSRSRRHRGSPDTTSSRRSTPPSGQAPSSATPPTCNRPTTNST